VVASGSSASVPLPSSSNSNSALGIWAARGLLLLVAAIWGTNFAVRRRRRVAMALPVFLFLHALLRPASPGLFPHPPFIPLFHRLASSKIASRAIRASSTWRGCASTPRATTRRPSSRSPGSGSPPSPRSRS
jgi:hypothetical protein